MGPGDSHTRAVGVRNIAQRLWVTEQQKFSPLHAVLRRRVFRVAAVVGRRMNDQVAHEGQIAGSKSFMVLNITGGQQLIGIKMLFDVTATDNITQALEQLGQGTHAGAFYADEVQAESHASLAGNICTAAEIPAAENLPQPAQLLVAQHYNKIPLSPRMRPSCAERETGARTPDDGASCGFSETSCWSPQLLFADSRVAS